MAQPTKFEFDLREVAINLIRSSDIREGKWQLGVSFNFTAANLGPELAETRPAAIAQVSKLSLTRQPEGGPDLPYVVDAAEVHSEPSTARPRRSSSTKKQKS